MKKLLCLFILIFAFAAYGQDYSPKKSQSSGKYTQMQSAGGDTVANLIYIAFPAHKSWVDSLVNQDTVINDFAYNYVVGYISVYDSSSTDDTVAVEGYSDLDSTYTPNVIGLRDVQTDNMISDNTVVVIAAGEVRKLKIENTYRPDGIRIRTLSNRSRVLKVKFEGVN